MNETNPNEYNSILKKVEIRDLFPALAAAFKAAYKTWTSHLKFEHPYEIYFEEGSKFCRIVMDDGQRKTNGFVCMVDTGKFKAGDLLKAAGWKAPALNFSRGSIFTLSDPATLEHVKWTGIS